MKTTIYLFLMLLCQFALAFDTIKTGGDVSAVAAMGDRVLAGTTQGTLELYSIESKRLLSKVRFDKVANFSGKKYPPKVFSVDLQKDGKLAVAAVEKTGVFIVDGQKRVPLPIPDGGILKKVAFLNDKIVLVAWASSDIAAIEIKSAKVLFSVHPTNSVFSDFAVSEDGKRVAIANESGEIPIIDGTNGKTIQLLKGQNVDNVYDIDIKNGVTATAGQDRRVAIYAKNSGRYIQSDFLVYAAALSPSASRFAYSCNEQNDLCIVDSASLKRLELLKAHLATPHTIVFLNEKRLLSAAEESKIILWELKK